MSRAIQTSKSATTLSGGPGGPGGGGDDYFARLVKYIPAEVVALYLGAAGLISTHPNRAALLLWIFWFCLFATPLFMWVVTSRGGQKPVAVQIILATVAFAAWAGAIGAPYPAWYDKTVASLVVMALTFLLGLVKP